MAVVNADAMKPRTTWAGQLRDWAGEAGFSSVGVADVDLRDAEQGLRDWLGAAFHGEMDYMARHGLRRARPTELVPGAASAIMVTVDYAPDDPAWVERAWSTLARGERAYVSRYALGRDYHKVVRTRLQRLAERIEAHAGPFGYRAFCDSAPVMEVELAARAGLGWRGKHTLLLNRERGSMFFLGVLLTDLPLPPAPAASAHCGSCTRCIDACPTGAIVAPYRLDARRCISYLTIEHRGPIPEGLRPLIGNHIYGCDDCLAVCPWNKFAQAAAANRAFLPRAELAGPALADLLTLDDAGFRALFSGSPIKRIGRNRFVRNCLYAAGNSGDRALLPLVSGLRDDPEPVVAQAATWAVQELTAIP